VTAGSERDAATDRRLVARGGFVLHERIYTTFIRPGNKIAGLSVAKTGRYRAFIRL
jgi:hypothetical protein